MIFADLPLDEAEGAILAHGLRLRHRKLAKGRVLDEGDIADLRAAGFAEVVAARLEAGDLDENEAARRAAAAIAGPGIEAAPPFTGRCNLYAGGEGLLRIDRARIDALNAIDEALTVATIAPDRPVGAGQLVATVKVVPLGLSGDSIARWSAATPPTSPPISVAPFRDLAVGLLLSHLAGTRPAILDKTVRSVEARLAALGGRLAREVRCEHAVAAIAAGLGELAAAGCDPVVVVGASAIVDRRDVVPRAVERAGGTVLRLGMPVDPGHLTLLARCGATRILGLPGSARSPRLSGFDFILRRWLAGIEVDSDDIAAMGVGGLLKDIPNRPHPREARARRRAEAGPRVAAIVLAAGQSRRMGTVNKLLAEIDGVPMARRVVDAVAKSRIASTHVVTGHQSAALRAALAGCKVAFVDNPDYAQGLSASLRAGIGALDDEVDGALILLGDMPRIEPGHIDRLIAAFAPAEGRAICVPTARGKRGNPVLFGRAFFADLARLAGDVGARHLIGEYGDQVHEVELADDGIFVDIDTPGALAALDMSAETDHAL